VLSELLQVARKIPKDMQKNKQNNLKIDRYFKYILKLKFLQNAIKFTVSQFFEDNF